ncbi:MAG: hypothetical protein AAGA54_24940, partial [Myxococcota bacterium]
MQPIGHRPRPRPHRFTGPALMLFFGLIAAGSGAIDSMNAYRYPEPQPVECTGSLLDGLRPAGQWLSVSGYTPDFEGAMEIVDGERTESIYIPLRTDDGQPAGLLR